MLHWLCPHACVLSGTQWSTCCTSAQSDQLFKWFTSLEAVRRLNSAIKKWCFSTWRCTCLCSLPETVRCKESKMRFFFSFHILDIVTSTWLTFINKTCCHIIKKPAVNQVLRALRFSWHHDIFHGGHLMVTKKQRRFVFSLFPHRLFPLFLISLLGQSVGSFPVNAQALEQESLSAVVFHLLSNSVNFPNQVKMNSNYGKQSEREARNSFTNLDCRCRELESTCYKEAMFEWCQGNVPCTTELWQNPRESPRKISTKDCKTKAVFCMM